MKNSINTGLIAVIMAFSTTFLQAQLNMELVGHLDYDPTVNDIWGYVDSSGLEYAIVGNTNGVSIVSLENPAEPAEVAYIPGQPTTWRDIKTWGHYAYVVSDNTSEGMLIVDMQHLPDSVEYVYWAEDVGTLGKLRKSHNIFIDEFGLAYLAGCNLGGVVVFDVNDNPWNPRYINRISTPYSHDVYVRDSLIYASEIYEGTLTIYDFSDTTEFVRLGSAPTPFDFTHNAWLSDDSKFCFTTDERANAFVGAYDVSDPSNIKEVDRYRPASTVGLSVIPHNVHVWNDFLIISYYTDGCILVDAAKPDNLIEVGNFDTYLGANGGYNGAWGAYPFLPSGLVLTSDRQSGLYVFQPHYVRGCYLDVTVLDAETDEPIFNSEVSITADEIITPDFTNVSGLVKMGKAVPGSFDVTASHPRYQTGTVTAEFENGVQTDITIRLVPKPLHTLYGEVLRAEDEQPVPFAHVVVTDGYFSYETTADADGNYEIVDVIEAPYKVYVGLFDRYLIDEVNLGGAVNRVLRRFFVPKGYYDDFYFDYGWTVSGNSTGATWVRDVPILESFFGYACNPEFDVPEDFGDEAFVTGNLGGDAADNSVQDGFTLLSSPEMDMSSWNDAVISYRGWICTMFPDVASYFVLVSNGTDTVVIDTIQTTDFFGNWLDGEEHHLPDTLIELTSTMKVHFRAENNTDGNVVKAALDEFSAFDADPSTALLDPIINSNFIIYPNPGTEQLVINLQEISQDEYPDQVEIVDLLGRRVLSRSWVAGESTSSLHHQLQAGIYFVSLVREGSVIGIRKYVVE